MDAVLSRDSSPRSKPSLGALIKEKARGADFVAVGVNLVVAALLIGGVIGAMSVKDSSAMPTTDLQAAALAAQGEAARNETAPSPAPSADEGLPDHEEDDERDADK